MPQISHFEKGRHGSWFYVTRNILNIIESNLRELALIIASCIFEVRTLCRDQGVVDFSFWGLFYLQSAVSAHTVTQKSSKWTWLWNVEVQATGREPGMRNNKQFWYRKGEKGLHRLLIYLAWGWKTACQTMVLKQMSDSSHPLLLLSCLCPGIKYLIIFIFHGHK